MPMSLWPLMTIALLNTVLGVLVFWRAQRTRDKVFFCLFAFSVALWSAAIGFFVISQAYLVALFWAKIIFFSGSLIPFLFYYFSKNFPKPSDRSSVLKITLLAIPPVLINIFLWFTPWLIASVEPTIAEIHSRITFGPVMPLYSIYFACYTVVSIINLRQKYQTSKDLERLQIAYALLAFLLGIIFAGITNILLPLFNIYTFALIGPYFSLFFVGIITYAILRYRLMNIEIVIKRSAIYAALIGVILALYLLIVFIVDMIFQTGIIHNNAYLIILTISVTITAVSFTPLENWLQRVTDHIFFKGKYDYRKTLLNLGKTVAGLIKLDDLLTQVSNQVKQTIKVDKLFFFIYQKDSKQFVCRDYLGQKVEEGNISEKDHLIKYLNQTRSTLVLHEARSLSLRQPKLKPIWEEMNRLNVRVCIPLLSGNALLGIMCLGEKLSGDTYTLEDISLFDTFDYQLGTAIENAYLHQEALENDRQIERANRMATIGTMTAGIAHEIRNPLVALKTFSELLPKKFEDKKYRQKYMEIVPKEIDRINDLLESLLKLSRPTALKKEKVNLHELIQEVHLLLKNKIEENNIDFEDNVPAKILLSAERAQIVQVFINLMLNAIQFMPHGGNMTVNARKEKNKVVISIKDTGIGIPPENVARLFDPFFTTRHEGTGLGLTITQKIVEDHKGSISVRSKVGEGTEFILKFPAV